MVCRANKIPPREIARPAAASSSLRRKVFLDEVRMYFVSFNLYLIIVAVGHQQINQIANLHAFAPPY